MKSQKNEEKSDLYKNHLFRFKLKINSKLKKGSTTKVDEEKGRETNV